MDAGVGVAAGGSERKDDSKLKGGRGGGGVDGRGGGGVRSGTFCFITHFLAFDLSYRQWVHFTSQSSLMGEG